MSILRSRIRRRAIVSLKGGEAFAGVLWQWDRQALVLRNAAHVADPQRPVPVDGEVVVLAQDVAYVQFP